MKYYKYADDDVFTHKGNVVEATTYLEVDDNCPYRQITVGGGQSISSNINHPKWGIELGDQCADLDDAEGVISISEEEFYAVWHLHLAQHQQQWEAAKAQHPLGKAIFGTMLIFYPQGVLVDLGPNAVGVADYWECHASTRPEWMYTKHKIKAIVAGYDEENQWIRLQEPQVLKERVK